MSLSFQPHKAFTLIELLFVTAIIGILAAILFPVFGRARENARRSSCQSNLKQIGLGMVQYSQDFDEKYPLARNSGNPSHLNSWRGCVQPYIKSFQVFQCPSNTYATKPLEASEPGFRSYGLNGAAFSTGNTDAEIEVPTETIFVCESRYEFPDVYPSKESWSSFKWRDGDVGVLQGHLATTNFLFYDGHVKALKPVATLTTKLPKTLWVNKYDNNYIATNPADMETVRQQWLQDVGSLKEFG